MVLTGSTEALLFATIFFVGSHFFLSSVPVRDGLVAVIGENGFRLLYSAVAVASLAWVITAYRAAPHVQLWPDPPQLRLLPICLMPFACILVVAGITTSNVTMFAGERYADGPRPVWGIVTVTRHPALWGIALWSVVHLLANGDAASVILFGGMAVLCFGGMAHIDQRRRAALGSAWGPVALTTSVTPFLAALQGRTQVDWAGIGPWRVVGGLALYTALILTHKWAIGVDPLGRAI